MEDVDSLKKENARLRLQVKQLKAQLHHFCPDCRDKVAFEPYLRCQVQTLKKQGENDE